MSFQTLLLLALIAVAGSWRYDGLRPLSAVILLSVAVVPFTNNMQVADRMFVTVPVDVAWSVAAYYTYTQRKEWLGLVFLVIGILFLTSHSAFAISHNAAAAWYYVAFGNIGFVGSCLLLGGTGFVRSHSHLFLDPGIDHSRDVARKGG